ncbi:MAG: hypothetical protein KBT03_10240 [Bacteroidales bacterium]|nr:hypothetical protein [Candidatus Scybalousia scybalohippi]
MIDKNVYSTKGLYTFYQRAGRSDVITQVLTKDLYAIADRILEKVKD